MKRAAIWGGALVFLLFAYAAFLSKAVHAAVPGKARQKQFCEWVICPSSTYPVYDRRQRPPECTEGVGFLDGKEQADTFIRKNENTWYNCFATWEEAIQAGRLTKKEAQAEEAREK